MKAFLAALFLSACSAGGVHKAQYPVQVQLPVPEVERAGKMRPGHIMEVCQGRRGSWPSCEKALCGSKQCTWSGRGFIGDSPDLERGGHISLCQPGRERACQIFECEVDFCDARIY